MKRNFLTLDEYIHEKEQVLERIDMYSDNENFEHILYENFNSDNFNDLSLDEANDLLQLFETDTYLIHEKKIFRKFIDFLKETIKKTGDFLVSIYDSIALAATIPANIAVMQSKRKLPSGVTYLASKSDISTLTDNKISVKGASESDVLSKRESTLKSIKENSAWDDATIPLFEDNIINEEKVSMEHPDPMLRHANIDSDEFEEIVDDIISNPLSQPVMIWGAPGIGKTAIVKKVLKRVGKGKKRLIDATLSTMSQDDFFLPYFKKDTSGEIINADDLPKSFLPLYKPSGDTEKDKLANDLANGEDGGIIFFDELSRAIPGVQNVCLKLIGERKLGQYVLGDKWAIISASNRAEDDPYSVQNFSTALGNRFAQYNYVADFKGWRKWAEESGFVDKNILDFLEFNEKYFYNLDTESSIFASPRTWEIASQTLARLAQTGKEEGFDIMSIPDRKILRTIAASVGSDAAEEFLAYIQLKKTIKLEDLKLVFENPEKAPLPPKVNNVYRLDAMHAMISSIVERIKKQPTPEEFTNFCKYLVRLADESFAAKAFKLMLTVYPEINSQMGEEINSENKDYDKYAEGVQIFIKGYPRLAADYNL